VSAFGLPPFGVTSSLLLFAVIAISMIAITIFVLGLILPVRGRPPLVTQALIALMVIFSGSMMLLSLLFVFIDTNGTTSWTFVLLAFNFMMMGPAGIWFIGLIAFRDRRLDPNSPLWPAAIALVTTGSEVIMGVLFVVGDAGAPGALLPTLAAGLTSIWFFWSMAAVMFALVLWAPLARVERGALLALSASAVLGPWVTAYPTVGGLAMGGLMTLVFVALVRELARPGRVGAGELPLLLGLAAAFLATAITGFGVVATGGADLADLAFGAVMGTVMTVEIAYLFRRFYRGGPGAPWIARTPDRDELEPASAIEVAGLGASPIPPAALER
jgi:hypothetical protein